MAVLSFERRRSAALPTSGPLHDSPNRGASTAEMSVKWFEVGVMKKDPKSAARST